MTANHPENKSDEQQAPDTHLPEQERHEPGSEALAAVSDIEALQGDIDRLTNEAMDYKDKYVRAHAEIDNIRRRHERERSDLLKYGLENFIRDVLPVLDSLDKALPEDQAGANGAGDSEQASYLAGMVMVKKQLLDVLKKHGLEAVSAKGADFDPNVHQAIQRVESKDVQSEIVGDEYAKGYLLNGRLVRPAMVSVLVPAN